MYQLLNLIRNFIKDEEGATVVEYAVLVALIIAASVVIIGTLGTKINDLFNAVDSKFNVPT